MLRTWPEDWAARRAGQDCVKCAEGRPVEDPWGVRFFAGRWADAYLERQPPQPGTAVVIFRGGRHVADPCDFTDDELTGYWADVRTAAKAIERTYQPCQLNYAIFGNAVPHVHTHITPRYPDDPAPGRPLPDWVFHNISALPPQQLASQIEQLRHHLSASRRAAGPAPPPGEPGAGVPRLGGRRENSERSGRDVGWLPG